MGSVQDEPGHVEALGRLCRFRWEFYDCLTRRADALFEVADAVLCTDGPVRSSVDLTLAGAGPEHRRGHGALYDGLNSGRLDVARFRRTLAGLTLPSAADGRLMLAVDVSPWLRSEASTSAQRLFCHVHDRAKNQAQLIPGWPYSFVAALEPGRTSWTAVLDAVRLGPADDATAVTADQLRAVVGRLTAAGHWHDGDPNILIVRDAGYDVTRLAFVLDKPATWPEPQHTTTTPTSRYGTATATSWNRLHPRLTHRTCWINHPGDLPIIEGTLIRLQVDHLPGNRDPKPVWLWSSALDATAADIDRAWQAFLRRFDL
ncbi:transposase, partial [Parafrankia sp. FMc2]|uniref:transposase n=1 Tax=Parafrankia sp. FMc2 TaxID=3233196 RepID=UPI0034D3D0C8